MSREVDNRTALLMTLVLALYAVFIYGVVLQERAQHNAAFVACLTAHPLHALARDARNDGARLTARDLDNEAREKCEEQR